MEKKILIILTVLALSSGISYALHIAWNPKEKPPISLSLALKLAKAELEKEETEYFCVGASLAITFSKGDWELNFSSKDGKYIWISVGSDKKIRKSKTGFSYF